MQGFLQDKSFRGRGRGRFVEKPSLAGSHVATYLDFHENSVHAVADAACMHGLGEGDRRRKMHRHQVKATRALRLRWATARRIMILSMAPRGAAGADSAVGAAAARAEAGDLLQTISHRTAGQILPTRQQR